eukprot:9591777-Ditylum_brightwellii.AAC.1
MQEWEPDLYVDPRRSSHGGSFNSPELRIADKPQDMSLLDLFLLFLGRTLLNITPQSTDDKRPEGKVKISFCELLKDYWNDNDNCNYNWVSKR